MWMMFGYTKTVDNSWFGLGPFQLIWRRKDKGPLLWFTKKVPKLVFGTV